MNENVTQEVASHALRASRQYYTTDRCWQVGN